MNTNAIAYSITHPSKGPGLVIAVNTLFGRGYAHVFFQRTKETLTLPVDDLVICEPPEVRLQKGLYSSADRFLLRLLLEKIWDLKSGTELQSAGNFKIIPLPHQLLAVDFVLDQFKPRALIADEVGLGKTIEAALIYEELKARDMARRALVIAPSGLCVQWQEELKQKFFEDFSVYDRETVLSLKQLHGDEGNVWTLSDRIIASIDFIKPKRITSGLESRLVRQRQWHNRHVFEAVCHAGFDVVIIDEAHKLTRDFSGEETARYKVGKAFSEAAPVLLLLTATPHQGDSAKFKNLLGLIDPYLFYRESDVTPENVKKVTVRHNKRAAVDLQGKRLFKQRLTSLYLIERQAAENRIELELYEAVTEYVSEFYNLAYQQNDRTMMFLLLLYQRMVSSSSRAIFVSLSRRLESLSARRELLAGGADRPGEEGEEFSQGQLDELAAEEQLAWLEQHVLDRRDKGRIGDLEQEIGYLQRCVNLARRAAMGRNDAKFVRLLEVIDEFKVRENEPHLKFIIFTEFVETQFYLNECLQNLGYSTAMINGRMPAREKLQQKRLFQEGAQYLISTDAGGEGINLQFCRVMINYDLPWNPMRLEQRIGRIDRIGQAHDVKIVNFQLAGTVEQYVREVIERKLHTVQQEFQDGEDKLADILSTLQDEFSFENIYINAVLKRQREATDLESLAQEIYRRAREIISQGQLLIPFTEPRGSLAVNRRDLERNREQARHLVERYLRVEGRQLIPYRSRAGIYYFEDPVTGKGLHSVVFDPRHALENEDFELLGLSHPYMLQLVERLEDRLDGDITAKLRLKEKRFAGEKGYLMIYRLTLANYTDRTREYIIYCFVGVDGTKRERISRWFAGRDDYEAGELAIERLPGDLQLLCGQGDAMAEEQAEVLFHERSSSIEREVREAEKKMGKYYADKEESIRRVAVDNIRAAKLRELEQDRLEKQQELERRRRLAPSLERLQIAYVEFD